MNKKEFLEFHTGFFGETVDHVDQIIQITFSGEDLFEYIQDAVKFDKRKVREKPTQPARYRCTLCGRDKFTRRTAHYCNHGYRKRGIVWEEL